MFTDGGARGNPGPAAAGVHLKIDDREINLGAYLGETTNNQAEYEALRLGLKKVAELVDPTVVEEFQIYMDSELVVKQVCGEYRVKNPAIKRYWESLQPLMRQYPMIELQYVPRQKNKIADALVNQVLDAQNGVKDTTTTSSV